jgi:hypothetical protein
MPIFRRERAGVSAESRWVADGALGSVAKR